MEGLKDTPSAALKASAGAFGSGWRDSVAARNAQPTGSAVLAAHEMFAVADEGLLSASEFSAQLQREKRRAERASRALSLVLFRGLAGREHGPLGALLRDASRETDLVGRLGPTTLAVLCTDTDAQGRAGFLHKLAPVTAALDVTTQAGTFPDNLFDSVAAESAANAEVEQLIATEVEPVGCYAGKRAFDLVFATLVLLACAPLLLVIALVIALDSAGPVIYRQRRLGQGGAPFTFYKFRSMRSNVDDRVHRTFVLDLIRNGDAQLAPPGTRANPYKLSADPRITRVGRFIRKTSLDELPQLFNVLRGEMSLVGPRPPIPYEAARYQPWHLRRILAAKPGLTGLWQVEGRSRVSFNEMVRMDLRYIRDCSFALDLRILLRTVSVVVRGFGGQ